MVMARFCRVWVTTMRLDLGPQLPLAQVGRAQAATEVIFDLAGLRVGPHMGITL